jgi:hypothetical protein
MKTMFGLMNSTASLSSQCVAAHDYKCLFAPIAIAFITTPIFALNSEYDASVRLFSFSLLMLFSLFSVFSFLSPFPHAWCCRCRRRRCAHNYCMAMITTRTQMRPWSRRAMVAMPTSFW